MSTAVKYIHSGMTGAPKLNTGPGALIAVLDAALLNGFNLVALDSLTYDSAAGECTGQFSGHGFELHSVILIEGANEAGFNGEHRITFVDSSTFKFAMPTDPGATAATGTVTAKTAPLGGWEKAFDNGSATISAYRSVDARSTGCLLRVDDSNTASGWNSNGASAFVTGVESMTDIDTLNNPFVASGWNRWRKNRYTSGDHPYEWEIVGDSMLFYFNADTYGTGVSFSTYMFGDIISHRPGDAFHCVCVAGCSVANYQSGSAFGEITSNNGKVFARSYSQLPGAVGFSAIATSESVSFGYAGVTSPSAADNSVYFQRDLLIKEGGAIRGRFPGLMNPLHKRPFLHKTVLEQLDGQPAMIVCLSTNRYEYVGSSGDVGMFAVNVLDDWRAA